MVSKTVILFIFTASVASGRIIPKWPRSHPHQMVLMPTVRSLDNPQIFTSPYIQQIVENCDEPQPKIVPLPMAEKPLVFPQVPILAPIEIPKFPAPVMVETPISPIVEPCDPAMVPEIPAVDIPAAPALPPVIMPVVPEVILQAEPCLDEVVPNPHLPAVPQPPELPAFVMPELPAIAVSMPEPCLEDQPIPAPEYVPPPMPLPVFEPDVIPEMPILNIPVAPALPPQEIPIFSEIPEPCIDEEDVQKISHPMIIPQAPELPAFVMPELPVRVEAPVPEPYLDDLLIPVAPVSDYIPMPAPMPIPTAEPCEPVVVPVSIPMAPELPPLAMPALPEVVALPEPCLDEVMAPEVHYQHMIVPQAPELPAFVMPELPIKIEAPISEPCLEDQPIPLAPTPEYIPLPAPMPMPIEEPCEPALNEILLPEVYEHMVIPQAPELPAFVMPELAAKVEPLIVPCPEDIPVAIPEYVQPTPLLPAIPSFRKTAEIPVRLEMPSPIMKPDPCVGEIALVVPQLPKLPEPIPVPIMPSHPELTVDPCDSAKPAMMALPPYFASHPSYTPMGFFPSGSNLLGMIAVPHVRHL